MGEPEQVIAEPDEVEEHVEGLHPPTLQEQTPKLITDLISTMTSYMANGWYIVGFLLFAFIVWTQLESKVKRWLKKREDDQEASLYHKNPDILLARHQALDEARQRMQDQYNTAACKSLEKKEREKKMREDKIAEWERMQPGKGHKLMDKSSASVSASSSSSAKGKPATKPRMRPEYNPMTGDTGASSSCRWRPTGRGSSGGG